MELNRSQSQCSWLTIGAIALACFGSAHLTAIVLHLGIEAYPIWFPAGISLAALLLWGSQAWIGIAIGTLAFGLSLGAPVPVAGVAALGSTLSARLGDRFLRYIGFQTSFRSLHDVLGFVLLAVILSPMVNSTISTLNGCLAGITPWQEFGPHWWTIWLGDGMGILVLTPLLLTWLSRPLPVRLSARSLLQKWRWSLTFRQRTLEVALWAALLFSVSWLVFLSPLQTSVAYYPLEYLPFPFLVWAALRLGQRITILSSLLVSLIANWGTVQQAGPFWLMSDGDGDQAILLLQAFVGVIAVTALVLATAVSERQQTEELLRRSEASLLNAQRIAQVGNWDLDLPLCCGADRAAPIDLNSLPLRWSDELYRILGVLPQSYAPSLERFLQAVHPDDRPYVEQAIQQAVMARSPYQLDYRILLPAGSERLVSEQVEVTELGITGTLQDITDRTRAETALRESEARFRSMFEAAAIGIGLDNLQGRIVESNPALQQMLGYSRAELNQMTFAEFSHPDDVTADLQQFEAMVAGRIDSYQMEKRHLRKDGQVVWVRLTNSLVRDAAGNPQFTIGMVENITERKQAEEALQHSEARFRVVAETAACAFLVYQGSRLKYVNPATEAITSTRSQN